MHENNRYDDSTEWEVPGQVHRNYRRNRRGDRWKSKKKLAIQRKIQPRVIAIAVCVVVMIVAAVNLLSWAGGAISTWRTNRELQALRDQAVMENAGTTQQPIMTPYPMLAEATATVAPTVYEASPQRTPVSLVTATPIPQNKLFYQTAGEMLPEMKTLYQKNSDLVGWLTIPGVVDLPVVYRNNSYYLNHDFNKNTSKSGTLFLDEHHPLKSTTQHLVIHGHNMNDGSMFGLLAHYKDKKYVLEHGIITFSTLYEKQTYAVIAVSLTPENVSAPNFIPYIGNATFASDSAFNYYIQKVEDGALYRTYLDVKPTDTLLTLSTCLDDDRLLVVCRRLRDGETVDEVKRVQKYSIN